jgi:Flp pilus assembly protein CpaB
MNTEAMIVIFALVAAVGLLGVIAVDSFTIQKVDASGCTNGVAFNASKGRCFGH